MSAAPHLALFVPTLAGGGAQLMTVNLANEFARRGHPSDLVLLRREGPFAGRVAAEVRVVELGGRRVGPAVPRLAGYLRRERPAALAAALTHANLAALLARRLAGAPVRITVTERNHLSTASRNAELRRKRLLPGLARLLYPGAEGIIGISQGVVDDLAGFLALPASRMRAVHNPVLTPELRALPCRIADHPWLGGGGPPVVLAVGRLVPQKDYPTLLRAVDRLRQHRPVRLLVLGEGTERPALERLVAERGLGEAVCLQGFVDDPLAYMRGADLFALSSAWEGFGNVVVEALYCGLPVVATDCPSGPAEILEDGRHGRLVPVGDDAALAAAIAAALDAPPPADALRRRALDFSVERIADAYLEVMLGERERVGGPAAQAG